MATKFSVQLFYYYKICPSATFKVHWLKDWNFKYEFFAKHKMKICRLIRWKEYLYLLTSIYDSHKLLSNKLGWLLMQVTGINGHVLNMYHYSPSFITLLFIVLECKPKIKKGSPNKTKTYFAVCKIMISNKRNVANKHKFSLHLKYIYIVFHKH